MGFIYFGFDSFNQRLNEKSSINEIPVVFSSIKIASQDYSIRKIFLGWSSLFYLTEEGILIHCGYNSGKVDPLIFDLDCEVKCVASEGNYTYLVTKSGKCQYWNDNDYSSSPIPIADQPESVKSVVLGELYSVLLSSDGALFSLCDDKIEKLPFTPIIKTVSCGKEHVLCLTEDGKIYSFGLSSRGQLGHGNTDKEETPRVVEGLEGINVKTVSAGGWHSAAVTTIGDIYMWGWNESGQLGLPASSDRDQSEIVTFQAVPRLLDFPNDALIKTVSCGSRHTAIATEDGQLWTWGWNGYKQLGIDETSFVDHPICIQLPPEYKVQDVICQYWSTLVIV